MVSRSEGPGPEAHIREKSRRKCTVCCGSLLLSGPGSWPGGEARGNMALGRIPGDFTRMFLSIRTMDVIVPSPPEFAGSFPSCPA